MEDKKKNVVWLDAQITVMAALSMTLVLSLILTCYKSVLNNTYYTQIKEACMLSMEAEFAAYNNDMLDEYNILLLKNDGKMESRIEDYIKKNVKSYGDDIELADVQISDIGNATSSYGRYFEQEIVSYMKYGVYSEILDTFLESEEQVEKAKKTKEITDEISACEEQLFEMDSEMLKLVMAIEGIKTTDAGIVIKNEKTISSEDSFVKMLVNGTVDMERVYVDNAKVYESVKRGVPGYQDVSVVLQDMLDDVDGLYEVGDEVSNESGSNSYSELYKRNYKILSDAIQGVYEKILLSLDILEDYDAAKTGVAEKLDRCTDSIESSKEALGEDLYNGFWEDINEMKKTNESNEKSMCDVEEVTKALKRNLVILDGVIDKLPDMDIELVRDNCKETRTKIVDFQTSLSGISCKGLKFDYTGVDFSSEGKGLSAIKKIRDTFTDGLLGLVVDPEEVSEKTIGYSDLATVYITDEKSETRQSWLKNTADDVLVNEYLLMKFNSYTDFVGKDDDSNELLDYMLEYILCGENSDKDNLKQTMLEISAIREGMNLAYLLTDPQKKAEALTLATEALGFTGNMAIIKAGQYLILSVWAYGEAIIDLKKLYMGEKVDFNKTKKTWNLSLANLLLMNLSIDSERKSETGLDYKMYLRMLLVMERREKKIYTTMGAMELHMITMGNKDFRMRNYIVWAKGIAIFKCKDASNHYKQEIGCSYI